MSLCVNLQDCVNLSSVPQQQYNEQRAFIALGPNSARGINHLSSIFIHRDKLLMRNRAGCSRFQLPAVQPATDQLGSCQIRQLETYLAMLCCTFVAGSWGNHQIHFSDSFAILPLSAALLAQELSASTHSKVMVEIIAHDLN